MNQEESTVNLEKELATAESRIIDIEEMEGMEYAVAVSSTGTLLGMASGFVGDLIMSWYTKDSSYFGQGAIVGAILGATIGGVSFSEIYKSELEKVREDRLICQSQLFSNEGYRDRLEQKPEESQCNKIPVAYS
jgi:glutamine cyclotransferase